MFTDVNGGPIDFALGDLSQPRLIKTNITLTKEQYGILSKGLMAHGEDDRWIVFCRGLEFYFHESWGGKRIYQTSFSSMDNEGNFLDTYSCNAFFVENNQDIFRASREDEAAAKRFQELIETIVSRG